MDGTMESLINEVGEECLNSDKDILEYEPIKRYFLGELQVIYCLDKITNRKYYTILNLKNKSHVHALSKTESKLISECFYKIIRGKSIEGFSFTVRNKSIKLCGFKVKYR